MERNNYKTFWKIITLHLFLFLFIVIGCSKKSSTTLDFKYGKTAHLLIPAKINDSIVDFIFDFGSTVSCIYKQDINNKNISISNNVDSSILVSSFSKILMKKTEPISVKIGNIELDNKISFEISDSLMPYSILGNDIINKFNWHFNFAKQKVTMQKEPFSIPDQIKASKINYALLDTSINVFFKRQIQINDSINIIDVFIDSGCVNLYKLTDTSKNVTEILRPILNIEMNMQDTTYLSYIGKRLLNNDVDKSSIKRLYDDNHKLIGKSFLINYKNLKIENFKLNNCCITIEYNKNIPAISATLNLHFFTQFAEMYIDTQNQVIYLKPYEESK